MDILGAGGALFHLPQGTMRMHVWEQGKGKSRIILQITLICDSGFAVGDMLTEEGWHYWIYNLLLGYWNHSLWAPAKFKDGGHSAALYSSAFFPRGPCYTLART